MYALSITFVDDKNNGFVVELGAGRVGDQVFGGFADVP